MNFRLFLNSMVKGGRGGGKRGGAGKSKEEGGFQRGDFKPLNVSVSKFLLAQPSKKKK